MNFFFRQVRPLERILEREFNFCSQMPGIGLSDFRQLSLQEQTWFIFRLVRQHQDQEQAMSNQGMPNIPNDSQFLAKRTF